MSGARLKHYGWGREDEGMTAEEQAFVLGRYRAKFARDAFETKVVPRLEDLALRTPRVAPPASLATFCSSERYDRVAHAYGKSYPDYVRAMLGDYHSAPDVVAYPRNEAEISAVMDWTGGIGASLTPFGGGSSVCGGVEPRVDGLRYKAAVTLDLRNLGKVIEVDQISRAALIEGGAYGPSLENQLKPHGLTLRHFPQSFEYSTLGGWIATRSGGHFATGPTHIDELVESVRALTPSGPWESRRLPGSGAGPSPDRMLIGSEGILGVIVDAWVRVRERPTEKVSCGVAYDDFAAGAEAVREISQSGLNPSNCRLLDATESDTTSAGPPGKALLVLGFESAHFPVEEPMSLALDICRNHGGDPGEMRRSGAPGPGDDP